MNCQVKRYRVMIVSFSAGASGPWSWGAPPSRHMDVFTNLEAL